MYQRVVTKRSVKEESVRGLPLTIKTFYFLLNLTLLYCVITKSQYKLKTINIKAVSSIYYIILIYVCTTRFSIVKFYYNLHQHSPTNHSSQTIITTCGWVAGCGSVYICAAWDGDKVFISNPTSRDRDKM